MFYKTNRNMFIGHLHHFHEKKKNIKNLNGYRISHMLIVDFETYWDVGFFKYFLSYFACGNLNAYFFVFLETHQNFFIHRSFILKSKIRGIWLKSCFNSFHKWILQILNALLFKFNIHKTETFINLKRKLNLNNFFFQINVHMLCFCR